MTETEEASVKSKDFEIININISVFVNEDTELLTIQYPLSLSHPDH